MNFKISIQFLIFITLLVFLFFFINKTFLTDNQSIVNLNSDIILSADIIIEAAICNLFIISSDCNNGPKEFLNNGEGGILFKSNKDEELFNSLVKFEDMQDIEKFRKKVYLKKRAKNYSIFNHFKILNLILNNIKK